MLIKIFLTDKKQLSLEEAAESIFVGSEEEGRVVKSKVRYCVLINE
jgi:hypothetical protein